MSDARDDTDGDDILWNDSEDDGNVRNECKALNVKMETVMLIGKGRYNLTCCVYYVYEINSVIFLLIRHFIFGVLF